MRRQAGKDVFVGKEWHRWTALHSENVSGLACLICLLNECLCGLLRWAFWLLDKHCGFLAEVAFSVPRFRAPEGLCLSSDLECKFYLLHSSLQWWARHLCRLYPQVLIHRYVLLCLFVLALLSIQNCFVRFICTNK